jgi:hypothetical protein
MVDHGRLNGVEHLTVAVQGRDTGSYTAGMADLKRGSAAGVLSVSTAKGQQDLLDLDIAAPKATLTSGGNISSFRVAAAMKTPEGTRSSVLSGMTLKAGAAAALDVSGDQIATKGPTGGLLSLWAKVQNLRKQSTTENVELTGDNGRPVNWTSLLKRMP